MEKTKEPDLIDRIADALPPEVRTAYYREMRHCKSLPESDEMLRILRAMMFLTLLTEQVPNRVLTEREKFEAASHEIVAIAKRLITVGSEYYQKLDKQLTRLPDEIATGVNPVAIVERINGSLKRQFDLSTIPVVAKELAANAGSIKTATKDTPKRWPNYATHGIRLQTKRIRRSAILILRLWEQPKPPKRQQKSLPVF